MTSNSSVLRVEFSGSTSHIAEVILPSGLVQRPTWSGLRRYWTHANAHDVEYTGAQVFGEFVLFCILCASGQGGVVAVWNTTRRRWEHVSDGSYVFSALLLLEIPAIVAFASVSSWSGPAHHVICARRLDRTLDASDESGVVVPAEVKGESFDPSRHAIRTSFTVAPDATSRTFGIYRLEDSTIVASDVDVSYLFSVEAVRSALLDAR